MVSQAGKSISSQPDCVQLVRPVGNEHHTAAGGRPSRGGIYTGMVRHSDHVRTVRYMVARLESRVAVGGESQLLQKCGAARPVGCRGATAQQKAKPGPHRRRRRRQLRARHGAPGAWHQGSQLGIAVARQFRCPGGQRVRQWPAGLRRSNQPPPPGHASSRPARSPCTTTVAPRWKAGTYPSYPRPPATPAKARQCAQATPRVGFCCTAYHGSRRLFAVFRRTPPKCSVPWDLSISTTQIASKSAPISGICRPEPALDHLAELRANARGSLCGSLSTGRQPKVPEPEATRAESHHQQAALGSLLFKTASATVIETKITGSGIPHTI